MLQGNSRRQLWTSSLLATVWKGQQFYYSINNPPFRKYNMASCICLCYGNYTFIHGSCNF